MLLRLHNLLDEPCALNPQADDLLHMNSGIVIRIMPRRLKPAAKAHRRLALPLPQAEACGWMILFELA